MFSRIIKEPEDGSSWSEFSYIAAKRIGYICDGIAILIFINLFLYFTHRNGYNYPWYGILTVISLPFIIYYTLRFILPASILIIVSIVLFKMIF